MTEHRRIIVDIDFPESFDAADASNYADETAGVMEFYGLEDMGEGFGYEVTSGGLTPPDAEQIADEVANNDETPDWSWRDEITLTREDLHHALQRAARMGGAL